MQEGREAGQTKELTNRPFPGQGGKGTWFLCSREGQTGDTGLPGFSIGSSLHSQSWLGSFSDDMTSLSLEPRQHLFFFFLLVPSLTLTL